MALVLHSSFSDDVEDINVEQVSNCKIVSRTDASFPLLDRRLIESKHFKNPKQETHDGDGRKTCKKIHSLASRRIFPHYTIKYPQ